MRLEYESLFALGSLCGVGDGDAVLRASQRCDELGIDTISTGGTIAFAMECVERGLLDEPWLTFGSGDAVLRAIELIGRREGLGELLAEGSRRAAQAIGQGSIAFAPQVKGLEIPGYEPRALQTMALGFAVGARGADHNRSGAYEVDFSDKVDRRHATLDSVRHAIETEDRAALMDSLILCKFLRGVFTDFYAEAADMLRAVTGWDVTADELRDTARRIVATQATRSTCSPAGRRPRTRCPSVSSTRRCRTIPRRRSRASGCRNWSRNTIVSAAGDCLSTWVGVRGHRHRDAGGHGLVRHRRSRLPSTSAT